MRVYTLQIHTTGDSEKMDELYQFSSFDNLCREYDNKFRCFSNDAGKMIERKEPKMDEAGEVSGGFKFENADGSLTIGKTYDYDILDDD